MAFSLRSILSPFSLGEGFGVWLLSALLLFSSCSSDDTEVFGVKPTGGVEFTPIPGGARMTYTLPNNPDIAEIRARYFDVNGKEVIVGGSYHGRTLQLVGFNEAKTNVPVYISYVDINGNVSEEYETQFSTADSGAYAFFNSVEVKSGWNGFQVSYNLPDDGMTGFAHIYYVGINNNTQKQDTLLLSTITLQKGEFSQFYVIKQENPETTVVIQTEDFRGYFVKKQEWKGIQSFPTKKYDITSDDIECELSYEDDFYKLGKQYLTDGDLKGYGCYSGDWDKYYTFAMGPYAFGENIDIDLHTPQVPASVRIYAQMSAKAFYDQPVWNGNYIDTLPCEVTIYGSNDGEQWTKLGYYSEPKDATGKRWYGRDRLVGYYDKLPYETIDKAEPIYLDITIPLSDDTYRYIRVVPNQTFDKANPNYKNYEQYVTMQELEIYVKK